MEEENHKGHLPQVEKESNQVKDERNSFCAGSDCVNFLTQ